MPNISTHINFLRILKNKYFNELDINFLTLGSIAPNYYIIFNLYIQVFYFYIIFFK